MNAQIDILTDQTYLLARLELLELEFLRVGVDTRMGLLGKLGLELVDTNVAVALFNNDLLDIPDDIPGLKALYDYLDVTHDRRLLALAERVAEAEEAGFVPAWLRFVRHHDLNEYERRLLLYAFAIATEDRFSELAAFAGVRATGYLQPSDYFQLAQYSTAERLDCLLGRGPIRFSKSGNIFRRGCLRIEGPEPDADAWEARQCMVMINMDVCQQLYGTRPIAVA